MRCITGKVCFETKSTAIEGLISSHIRHDHRKESGPINVYECQDCKMWHFTSKGEICPELQDPAIETKINREKQRIKWESDLYR